MSSGRGAFGRWAAGTGAGVVALAALLSERRNKPKTEDKPKAKESGEKSAPKTETKSEAKDAPESGKSEAKESAKETTDKPDDTSSTTETKSDAKPGPDYQRNGSTRMSDTTTRSTSAFPLASIAIEMNAVASRHAPLDMWQVARELMQFADLPANVALAIRSYTQRLQAEYPIHHAVVEQIHQLYQAQAKLTEIAQEVGPLFRRLHAEDLKRDESPRINEKAWNV